MANLFRKQAKSYADARPSYPAELFRFIASKTPRHDLAWDVGTGSGQSAVSVAQFYKNVVATDTSPEQLALAPKLPNIKYYHHTAQTPSFADLHEHVAKPSTVDLITVAQALHWFDLSAFYDRVNSVLAKPGGVLAAWCYTLPRVDSSFDPVFNRFYADSAPFWAPERKLVDEAYRGVEFPFDAVEGEVDTGPLEFAQERSMDLELFLRYIRSWSAYQTAKEGGVELLTEEKKGEMERAWGGDGKVVKAVNYPISLRIGKVRII